MYDWPEVRNATDALWQGLVRHIPGLPAIDRRSDHAGAWRQPDLLLSQTCGYPFTHEFRGQLKYLATPHYAADGCNGANYCSIVLARQSLPLAGFRGMTAAVNGPDSMSGMLALKLVFGRLAQDGRFFGNAFISGGHISSIAAVREGRADICAVDAVCLALARCYRPGDLQGLVEVARSPAVPGLPLVTVAGDVDVIRHGLASAFADPKMAKTREALLISGFSVLDPQAYDRILDLESQMQRGGGLDLI